MTRIPYVEVASLTNPEILGYLELARKEGTPRPESRHPGQQPICHSGISQAWELTFRQGYATTASKSSTVSMFRNQLTANTEGCSAPLRLGGRV